MVAILAGAAASPPDARGWVHGAANAGVDAIGMDETGAVAIGMDAIGTTGMEIGVIIMAIMSSLLVTSAFQDGGAGVGDIHITATGIRMVITGMAIRTDTVMATAGMGTVDMATAPAANTALPLGRE